MTTETPGTLDEVVTLIRHWQRETFPAGTLLGAANHLKREALEIVASADCLSCYDPGERTPATAHLRDALAEEAADALFMLVQLATIGGFSLREAAFAKLEKNRQRRWKPADAEGVIEHVKEGGE